MSATYYTYWVSPVGRLLLAGDGDALHCISFPKGTGAREPDPAWILSEKQFREPVRQLEAYFGGSLRAFNLKLEPEGTPFQLTVWRALQSIPYGKTASYADIARGIQKPQAVRAVGAANGRNPLPIVIPCHRVIGSDGRLTGYGGGLSIKEALLELERKTVAEDRGE